MKIFASLCLTLFLALGSCASLEPGNSGADILLTSEASLSEKAVPGTFSVIPLDGLSEGVREKVAQSLGSPESIVVTPRSNLKVTTDPVTGQVVTPPVLNLTVSEDGGLPQLLLDNMPVIAESLPLDTRNWLYSIGGLLGVIMMFKRPRQHVANALGIGVNATASLLQAAVNAVTFQGTEVVKDNLADAASESQNVVMSTGKAAGLLHTK